MNNKNPGIQRSVFSGQGHKRDVDDIRDQTRTPQERQGVGPETLVSAQPSVAPSGRFELLQEAEDARRAFFDKPPALRGPDIRASENKGILRLFRKAYVVAYRVALMEANKSAVSTDDDRRELLTNLIPLDLEQEAKNQTFRRVANESSAPADKQLWEGRLTARLRNESLPIPERMRAGQLLADNFEQANQLDKAIDALSSAIALLPQVPYPWESKPAGR